VLHPRRGGRPNCARRAAHVERLLLVRRPRQDVRRASLARSGVPAAAGRAELRVVVDVPGSGGKPLRPPPTRGSVMTGTHRLKRPSRKPGGTFAGSGSSTPFWGSGLPSA
jgi:hypothetical protein